MRWLHWRADRLGFDAGNIVAAGSSAGAYLAAACADAAPAPLRGIVPVSGIYDVAPLIGTSINDALGLDDATAAALDLLTTARRFCPAVVAWGEIETSEFKRQSRAFAARLAGDAIPCTSLEVPGRNHFDVVLDLAIRRRRCSPPPAPYSRRTDRSRRYVTTARTRKRSSRHSPDSSTCVRRSTASQTSTKRV